MNNYGDHFIIRNACSSHWSWEVASNCMWALIQVYIIASNDQFKSHILTHRLHSSLKSLVLYFKFKPVRGLK